jgi:hypothetical protein
MHIFVVNTSRDPKHGGAVKNGLMKMVTGGCAAAWTDYVSVDVFQSMRKGDVVLLYENQRGYVAIGMALGQFSMTKYLDGTGRIDAESTTQCDEHRQRVSWEFYIPKPHMGFKGIRHGLSTCFRKDIDGVVLTKLREHLEKNGKAHTVNS